MAAKKRNYTYKQNGEIKTAFCTREEFVEIKRFYDDDGLTQLEEEYAELSNKFKQALPDITKELTDLSDLL